MGPTSDVHMHMGVWPSDAPWETYHRLNLVVMAAELVCATAIPCPEVSILHLLSIWGLVYSHPSVFSKFSELCVLRIPYVMRVYILILGVSIHKWELWDIPSKHYSRKLFSMYDFILQYNCLNNVFILFLVLIEKNTTKVWN